jgi:hypothetical protein
MDKTLKALIVVAVLMLPFQYFYAPKLKELEKKTQDIVNMQTANQILNKKVGNQTMRDLYFGLLQNQKQAIIKERTRLDLLMPPFSTARTSLLSPFELIRAEIPGEWTVTPNNKYIDSNTLVFWPFQVQYKGSAENAIKAIAFIESGNRFMRLRNISLKAENNEVILNGQIELVYQSESTGAIK